LKEDITEPRAIQLGPVRRLLRRASNRQIERDSEFMKRLFLRLSNTAFLAAAGGGLASALLSLLTVQKTTLALVMGCLSPLPIMLATLSFGAWPGWAAAVIGTTTVFAFSAGQVNLTAVQWAQLQPAVLDAATYAVSLAIPAWWLSRLSASTRFSASTIAAADQRKLGRIIAYAALFSVLGVAIDLVSTILTQGGFNGTMAAMAERVEPFVQTLLDGRELPASVTSHEVAVMMTWAQMPVLAAASLVLLGFNVWLAARITRASGRFPAPWPDLPHSLRVPRLLGLVLAAALGLTFAGGLVGMIALIAVGALSMAFAIQGIALIHDVTRGKTYRLPLLIILYLTLSMLMPWLVAVYAALGLGDAGFSFRNKPSRPQEPGKTWPSNN
jgi:uncharacterized protein YybS (DUF2232 family)